MKRFGVKNPIIHVRRDFEIDHCQTDYATSDFALFAEKISTKNFQIQNGIQIANVSELRRTKQLEGGSVW